MSGSSGSPQDLGVRSVLAHDGTPLSPRAEAVPEERLHAMHRHMVFSRIFDDKMMLLQRQGRIGFYGACTGQEAVPVAAGLALTSDDWVVPALRENFVLLVRGYDLKAYVAQLYGNALDPMKGRQMPCHPCSRQFKQVSWGTCVATQLPHATGFAWALRLRQQPGAVMAFVGDGATSEPDFHAALNFAALHRVPCVFVCQNNHWAISVPVARQTASRSIAVKASAYGMRGERVDGNDVLALEEVFEQALERARTGQGPTLIEALTYRMGPHSSSDEPSLYRTEQEVQYWRERDPLLRIELFLRRRGGLDPAALERLREQIGVQIDEAVAAVESASAPGADSLFDDVYAERPWHLREQARALAKGRAGGAGSEGG